MSKFSDPGENAGNGDFEDSIDDDLPEGMTPDMLAEEASMLAMEGDFDAAFEIASSAARAAQEEGLDSEFVSGALEIAAFSAIEMGADEQALEQIHEMRKRGFGDEANYHEARLRFSRWDFAEAKRLASMVRPGSGPEGGASYLRAMLAEFEGDFGAADALYAVSQKIDPEGFPAPVRLSERDVEDTLREAISALPEEIRDALANTVIEIVELPDPVADARSDMHPQMLGVFEGDDIGSESVFDPGGMPPRARIFKRNLERVCSTSEEVIEELTRTIYHEIGHRFGFDEDGLEGLDLD